ncbi:hypothetical protein OO013_15520 [Mangrovivirga sp. M17]|uniref:Outer membrane protein beta-barrel domain-containing protein n=1 Tax=Mangrovivirga halotolerans TaxID=2993936 RepID=A0ABT3RUP3_9BACT|nr:hypothetical protein [Mangrovivirga halotolerans]MCX2745287.1 hypothetical protein [Mangrovivirga halotolerans]
MENRDNLEELFRKGLAYEPTDYRESDWEGMSEKLDAAPEAQVNKWKKISYILTGVIILLLMYLGGREYALYRENLSELNISGEEEYQIDESKITDQNISESISKDFLNDDSESNSLKYSESNKSTQTFSKSNPGDLHKQYGNSDGYNTAGTNDISGNDEILKSIGSGGVDHSNIGDSKVVSGSNVKMLEASSDFFYTKKKTIHYNGLVHDKPQIILYGVNNNIIELESPVNLHPAISLAAYVAADMTTVNFSGFDRFDERFGFSIFLNLNENWSIETGANISNKYYWADEGSYTTGGYYSDPDQTYGVCEVLDIPLNVRYYFNTKGKTHWFISSGISSWLMLEERYDYYYEYNQYENPTGWYGENENYHWFGVLNFEAGLERRLTNKWSITATPYFNLPLKGVGNGQVRLLSNGLKIGLKFN